jgi:hypothetical protein
VIRAVVLLAVGVVVAAVLGLGSADARITSIRADGQIVHTGANGPLFTIANMHPGDEGFGEITLNSEAASADLEIETTRVSGLPGANGGRLSAVLRLVVEDVTGAPRALFDGRFQQGQVIDLGSLADGDTLTLRFRVVFPEGGAGDNAFMGSTMQVDFLLRANGQEITADSSSADSAVSAPPAVPKRFSIPLREGAGSQSPARRVCRSRRNFVIRLDRRLRSARVKAAGRRVRVRRVRGRLRARVDLRGMTWRTVKVEVVGRTRGGRRIKRTRRYHTCTKKRPFVCTSRRNFRIHVREPRGRRLRWARVKVNGRRVRVRRVRGRLTARVDLRGKARGRVRVRIVARTLDGRRLVGSRVYRTCARKRPGGLPWL